ncbi:hypothetical protein [Chitinophaga sp. 212800010-3]|uniref:hypothetical protein n=1 Tax=unclassified Chitinophaga TaxID=2619133 RepID=UPI002DE58B6C|nr:Neutral ceramidase [Chitinophaga sp. 212800010-3]
MEYTILQVGTAVADITPPLEVGLLTSSVRGEYTPFVATRLPLKARVLTLIAGDEAVALVSLDLLALSDTATGGWVAFKEALSGKILPENIIITCTHTHNAPESVGLSRLYLSDVYRSWLNEVKQRIKEAIQQAFDTTVPCTLSICSTILDGYSLQRRVPTAAGIIMSDALQPVTPEMMRREPVDRRVHGIRFCNDAGEVVATLVHAICHPVHEMCLPHISPDYPGELCLALAAYGGNGMALFLNGAAGDVNPPTVSGGPVYAYRHGGALAALIANNEAWWPVDANAFAFVRREIQFPVRAVVDVPNKEDALARISAVALGSVAIVFLPGEPFTETALEIEKASPFEHTLIAAYAENTIGYIPVAKAFKEGGYETGPGKWSFLEPSAAGMLRDTTIHLLHHLNANIKRHI